MSLALPRALGVAYRRVFMVLSASSLPYARHALESLFRNADEAIGLHLITDSATDREVMRDAAAAAMDASGYNRAEERCAAQRGPAHRCSVFAKDDLMEREAEVFGDYPKLRDFRNGHPCWRKITDPVLLSNDGQEMILLDPDLYFPNRFCFEETPAAGVLLMWQKPCCLFPAHAVEAALHQGIRFAHHVDIGVGAWRAPVDLAWLEWLLTQINVNALRRYMHIEACVWAALAMRIGGGYLDPRLWHCWHRTQPKRMLRKLGVPGAQLLRAEDFSGMKCFHACGQAKYWLHEAVRSGSLETQQTIHTTGSTLPFEELAPHSYFRGQRVKHILGRLGYYSVFKP